MMEGSDPTTEGLDPTTGGLAKRWKVWANNGGFDPTMEGMTQREQSHLALLALFFS